MKDMSFQKLLKDEFIHSTEFKDKLFSKFVNFITNKENVQSIAHRKSIEENFALHMHYLSQNEKEYKQKAKEKAEKKARQFRQNRKMNNRKQLVTHFTVRPVNCFHQDL